MGPVGLKGDEGLRGAPGDPAKGVRNNFSFSENILMYLAVNRALSFHNRLLVQLERRVRG